VFRTVTARCIPCDSEGELQLPPPGTVGPLACPNCGRVIREVHVHQWRPLIEARARRMARLQAAGVVGTRKQSLRQTDWEIDWDGREAELAACLILCPGHLEDWLRQEGANRGCDLRPEWTGLSKPIEVKHTRYCTSEKGYLLVRPPRGTPGPMLPQYIEDVLYVLMIGQHGVMCAAGWADRRHLIEEGQLNPVPVRHGQRQCWGIHWMKLWNLDDMVLLYSKAT